MHAYSTAYSIYFHGAAEHSPYRMLRDVPERHRDNAADPRKSIGDRRVFSTCTSRKRSGRCAAGCRRAVCVAWNWFRQSGVPSSHPLDGYPVKSTLDRRSKENISDNKGEAL